LDLQADAKASPFGQDICHMHSEAEWGAHPSRTLIRTLYWRILRKSDGMLDPVVSYPIAMKIDSRYQMHMLS